MEDQNITEGSQQTSPTYQQVDEKYISQLRIEISVQCLVVLGAAIALSVLASPPWHLAGIVVSAAVITLLLLLLILWAPRRFELTGYSARHEDVHYRTGALWRKHTAIPLNRVQHVEITQGVIERMLGLAKLVIYTAGGHGSDLAIPGLPFARAEALRDALIERVKSSDYVLSSDENNL